jgi:hypothetical protein
MNRIGLEIRQLKPSDPLQEKLAADCDLGTVLSNSGFLVDDRVCQLWS